MRKLLSGVAAFLGLVSVGVAADVSPLPVGSKAPIPLYWAFNEIAEVHDGDTFTIMLTPYFVENAVAQKVKVRLYGVDAPERKQKCNDLLKGGVFDCAENARLELDWLINENRGTLECLKVGASYDRWVMKCSMNGQDISSHLVSTGNAFVDKRFTSGDDERWLLALEETARSRGVGVHLDSEMIKPWDWRQKK